MTLKEAISLVKKNEPDLNIISSSDLGKYYSFIMGDEDDILLNSSVILVDKHTRNTKWINTMRRTDISSKFVSNYKL